MTSLPLKQLQKFIRFDLRQKMYEYKNHLFYSMNNKIIYFTKTTNIVVIIRDQLRQLNKKTRGLQLCSVFEKFPSSNFDWSGLE